MSAPKLKLEQVTLAEPVVTRSLESHLTRKVRSVHARRSRRHPARAVHLADQRVAEDSVVHPRSDHRRTDPSARIFSGAEQLVHPAAIRSSQTAVLEQPKLVPVRPEPVKNASTQSSPIKKITDLKVTDLKVTDLKVTDLK